MTELPPSLRALLPHGDEACFVREVLNRLPQSILCRGSLPVGSPFAAAGRAPAFVALEFVAQVAALLGDKNSEGPTSPRAGYLVRVRELRMPRTGFHVDADLLAEIVREGETSSLGLFRGSVRDEEGVLIEGAFSVYVER